MMKTQKKMKKEEKKKKVMKKESKIFLILGSVISLFFVIVGIVIATTDTSNTLGVISGILYTLAGIVIFPKIKLKAWIKGLIFIALIILAEII